MLPTKPISRTRNKEEHSEQAKLILLVRNELAPKYPILRWLHSIPNGLFLHKSVAATMVNEGAKTGVADLFLPVQSVELIAKTFPISDPQKQLLNLNLDIDFSKSKVTVEVLMPRYSGLYLEMKSKKGTHKQKQKEFADFVRSQGFKVVVPRSCDEALHEILNYCGITLD